MRALFSVLICSLLAHSAWAEVEDAIIVTGSRVVIEEMPGVVLKRNGDYLLLPVTVVNDSRLKNQRHDEIFKTLRKLLKSARQAGGIEIGVIVDERFVRPLTDDNYKIDLVENEQRPDTSRATIRVSAPLNQSSDPGKLIAKLASFVENAQVVGRTELRAEDEVEVSILNPGQYRDEIIRLVVEDVKRVTAALGEDYRIRLAGIDRQVKWVRSGLAEVTLYVPYGYEVLPAADAYFINENRYE
ncbi:MAG: hypothetical protein ACLFWF_02410 [Alphaproteobacteria bacterium]